jgi:diacylglycerol O-acyltransferase
VPGPQFPLYVLGRRLQVLYPVVPLARRQALGIAVMSYDGHLGFGLLADFDALPELEAIVQDLKSAIASLARAAGLRTPRKRPGRKTPTPGKGATDARAGAAADRRSPSKRASAS